MSYPASSNIKYRLKEEERRDEAKVCASGDGVDCV